EFVVEAPAGSDAASGRATTRDLVVRAARFGAEAIVVVGGDGTLSDAATALHAAGADVPIIGVGAGSTNAGALVSVDHTSVDRLLQGELHDVNVAALSLVLPGGGRCLAFNDVVVGTTVCGTLDGGYVNLAAEPFMRGQRTLAEPEPLRARGAVI